MSTGRHAPMRRYEIKYGLTAVDAAILEARLSALLRKDENARGGVYEIRSIYFDDAGDTHLREVEGGLSDRCKWRIRFYDRNPQYICLERKHKRNAMTLKESCPIDRTQMDALLRGLSVEGGQPLLDDFLAARSARGYRPCITIDYQRIPFVYAAGDVRITLDSQIACSADFSNPFGCTGPSFPVPGRVLEVKYTDFLPDFIRLALQINHLSPTAFSKYALGRKNLHYMRTGENL